MAMPSRVCCLLKVNNKKKKKNTVLVFLYQFSIYGHTQTKEEEEKKQVSGVENKVKIKKSENQSS